MKHSIRLQQWLLFVGAIIFVVGLSISVAYLTQEEPVYYQKDQPSTRIQINDSQLAEEHFVTTYGAQMQSLQNDIRALQNQVAQQKAFEEKRRQSPSTRQEDVFAQQAQKTDEWMNRSPTAPISSSRFEAHSKSVPMNRLAVKKVALSLIHI